MKDDTAEVNIKRKDVASRSIEYAEVIQLRQAQVGREWS